MFRSEGGIIYGAHKYCAKCCKFYAVPEDEYTCPVHHTPMRSRPHGATSRYKFLRREGIID